MSHTYDRWAREPRIPPSLRFPGGFTVPITLIPRNDITTCPDIEPGDNTFHLGDDEDSVYITDCGIFLWEGLTPKQRWHRLTHEALHALVDWQRWVEIKAGRS